MPVTKQYLRYEHSATFGIVCGRKANVLLQTQPTGGDERRALVVAPSAEDLVVWDPRRGEKVKFFLLPEDILKLSQDITRHLNLSF